MENLPSLNFRHFLISERDYNVDKLHISGLINTAKKYKNYDYENVTKEEYDKIYNGLFVKISENITTILSKRHPHYLHQSVSYIDFNIDNVKDFNAFCKVITNDFRNNIMGDFNSKYGDKRIKLQNISIKPFRLYRYHEVSVTGDPKGTLFVLLTFPISIPLISLYNYYIYLKNDRCKYLLQYRFSYSFELEQRGL